MTLHHLPMMCNLASCLAMGDWARNKMLSSLKCCCRERRILRAKL